MSLAPRPVSPIRRSIFSDSGERTAKLSLISAVYYDRTTQASDIIESDPDQINLQDPFAGLTALHIAIFRQNATIVERIAKHPVTRIELEDKFGRRAIDMCVYTQNEAIFRAVFERTFRTEMIALDVGDSGPIIPFRPE
ncbi:hypothetical protein GGD81_004185 [Rhodobium orientis]|uniref:Ankyrin repeat domain-containing protein n=1 Tax=Rhodobium orientis TaxID=34017 RepID=A0A327JKP3_9HYPH|nr:ankyrin repeat domain-containing protein [Rhodobium orientis]MBB4305117.1 hypothetical protein [Rhodobium orientis]MBK5950892.1 hypothetical protein [Rhodobium orientis]RAI27010.1 hypothetical protein CH339_11745 [Rhodobium orientis]